MLWFPARGRRRHQRRVAAVALPSPWSRN